MVTDLTESSLEQAVLHSKQSIVKKNKKVSCTAKVILDGSGIVESWCTCRASVDGKCQHVAATLLYLSYVQMKGNIN